MKEEKKMKYILCTRCFKINTFINGKCNHCKKDLKSQINKKIIIMLIFCIICIVFAVISFKNSMNIIGDLYSLGIVYAIGYLVIDPRANLKKSEENTRLKEELELMTIEAQKQRRLEREKEKQEVEQAIIRLQKLEQEIKEQGRKKQEELQRERKKQEEQEKQEKQEKIRLQKIMQKKMESFYKECSKHKLFEINNDENKNKILEIAEKYEVKEDIELLMQQMYYAESKKEIIFGDYNFLKPIKKIIKKVGIINFIKKCNDKYNFENGNEKFGAYFKKKILKQTDTIAENEISELLECIEYYNKILDIIEKDEELNIICSNLLETLINNKYIDYKYITKKVYDIYENSYKEKYEMNITQKDFSNIFDLMERKKRKKYNYSDLYTLISVDYKDVNCFPEKIYNKLIYGNRINFYEDMIYNYIIDKKSQLSFYEICRLLLDMDKMCTRYSEMVDKERERVQIEKEKEKARKQEQKTKVKIEQERLRLLKGDISKETKLNNTIKQKKIKQKEIEIGYQNVKDGFEFEEYVSDLYGKLGYDTSVTRKSGDQGADIVATKDGKTYVIQAKFYSSPVGNKAVQEVVASLAMYKADKGIVITNNTFTQSARELAEANNIELVDGDGIERYKRQILAKI